LGAYLDVRFGHGIRKDRGRMAVAGKCLFEGQNEGNRGHIRRACEAAEKAWLQGNRGFNHHEVEARDVCRNILASLPSGAGDRWRKVGGYLGAG